MVDPYDTETHRRENTSEGQVQVFRHTYLQTDHELHTDAHTYIHTRTLHTNVLRVTTSTPHTVEEGTCEGYKDHRRPGHPDIHQLTRIKRDQILVEFVSITQL